MNMETIHYLSIVLVSTPDQCVFYSKQLLRNKVLEVGFRDLRNYFRNLLFSKFTKTLIFLLVFVQLF